MISSALWNVNLSLQPFHLPRQAALSQTPPSIYTKTRGVIKGEPRPSNVWNNLNKGVFLKHTIKDCVSWSWRCPGTSKLTVAHLCPCSFVVVLAAMLDSRALEECGSNTKTRELLGGMEGTGSLILDCLRPAEERLLRSPNLDLSTVGTRDSCGVQVWPL